MHRILEHFMKATDKRGPETTADLDALVEIQKLAALEHIADSLAVCAMHLENIEVNLREGK